MDHTEKSEIKKVPISGITYTYERPSQVREIPPKAMSVRGHIPSLKPHLKGIRLDYESKLERQWLELLDHDPNCIDLQTQPYELHYTTISGKNVAFYPDIWAIFKDNRQFLFDVKPENKLHELPEDENWNRRLEAIFAFCKKKELTYQIITERKIKCCRLENIETMLVAAKHYLPVIVKEDLVGVDSFLRSILESGPVPFKQLVHLVSGKLNVHIGVIIAVVKFKIYYGALSIDWDVPLDASPVSFGDRAIVPVHELHDNFVHDSSISFDSPDGDSSIETKARVIQQVDKELRDFRMRLIEPIIMLFGKGAGKEDIRQFCEKNGGSFPQTYRWYLRWKDAGDSVFLPKHGKHKKSHLDPLVYELMVEIVQTWNSGMSRSKSAAYADFSRRCDKANLKPATYKTFLSRIKQLRFFERKGKFTPGSLESIDRALRDSFSEKRCPGFLIQMDNAQLDIWCVDRFSKHPLGRPWLTMGIDVFSGGIWGYFLSFESPSVETATRAILNGLTCKEETPERKAFEAKLLSEHQDPMQFKYPCAGYPAIIQVDNGKDFQSNDLKDLCMKLNITLEYRPVKTPDYGGFIESTWDTINDDIRNFELFGRVYPIPKTREPVTRPKFKSSNDYNPQEDAKLTLEDLADWFYEFLVIRYSNKIRARQQHAPSEIWCDGTQGENHQPLGGLPRIPSQEELTLLEFHSKRTIRKSLSRHGFRYKNILYSSAWIEEARLSRVLKDKKKYELKISHWDIRFAYIVNPETQEIEKITAYKYDGDQRVNEYLLQGLGKIPGMKSFPVTLNALTSVQVSIGNTTIDSKPRMIALDLATKTAKDRGNRNKKERKLLDHIAQSKEGKEKLTQSAIIAQLDSGSVNVPTMQRVRNNNPQPVVPDLPVAVLPDDQQELDDRVNEDVSVKGKSKELEAFPTELDEIPDDMKLSYMRR